MARVNAKRQRKAGKKKEERGRSESEKERAQIQTVRAPYDELNNDKDKVFRLCGVVLAGARNAKKRQSINAHIKFRRERTVEDKTK